MALDTSKYKNNPLTGSANTDLVKIQAASVKQQMVTNALLNDLVNLQTQTLKLQRSRLALENKMISKGKFTAQETAIEKQRKAGPKISNPFAKKGGSKKGLDFEKLKKALLAAGAAGALTLAVTQSDAILGVLADGVEGLANALETADVKLQNFGRRVAIEYGKLRNLMTPIAGFSAFGIGNIGMGLATSKKMSKLKDGAAVRSALWNRFRDRSPGGIRQTVRNTAGQAATTTARAGGRAFDAATDGLDTIARSPVKTKGFTLGGLKNSLDEILFDARLAARTGDPSKSVASRFQRLVGGGANAKGKLVNTAGAIKQQGTLFMQGITGAQDASVLRTAGRPFPNIARGAGSLADEAGGFFRAGRGIRTGIANIASGKALQQLATSLSKLKIKPILALANIFKALPGQILSIAKGAKGFVGTLASAAKSGILNFNIGKALAGAGKGLAGGASALLKGGKGVLGAGAGALQRAAMPLGRIADGGANLLKGGGNILSKGVGRVPVIGSLLSAGFGAMEANEEEMKRLMEENNMTREQVNAGLADGSLQKDKAKIVGRSAGAGLGAGSGAVIGGFLGAVGGPVGIALGAAVGSWLGENVGKFLGEGFANTFKSFDWGKTFGPVITSFKELGGSITSALDTVAGAFGIGGDGEDGSGGFINVLKNIGRVIGILAKLLMKVLAPLLQIVAKYYKMLVDIAAKIISTIGTVVKGGLQLVKGLIEKVPGWLGGDALRNMLSGVEGAFEGDVIGNINSFVDGMDLSLPNAEEKPQGSGDDRGIVGRTPMMGGMGGQYGMGGQGGAGAMNNIVVTSRFGWRDMDGDGKKEDNHMGVDIAAPEGTPLVAFSDGVVQSNRGVGYFGGYGNTVIWNDDNGRSHLWAHMQNRAKVREGQKIKKGDLLGYVGNTGRSTGPHLHWEVSTSPTDVGAPKSMPGTRGDALKMGYDWKAPFSGKSNFSSNSADMLSSTSSAFTSQPSSVTSRVTGRLRGLEGRLRSAQTSMQEKGVPERMSEAATAAFAPMASLMEKLTAAANAPVGAATADGGTTAASGNVALFPTMSPVKDGGHIFNLDF